MKNTKFEIGQTVTTNNKHSTNLVGKILDVHPKGCSYVYFVDFGGRPVMKGHKNLKKVVL